MRFRIVNIKRFITSITIVLGILILVSLIISKASLSHGEIIYKKLYVSNGDTLWSLAKQEKQINDYYENKDIRYIVNQIQEINNLQTSALIIGQELLIPTI